MRWNSEEDAFLLSNSTDIEAVAKKLERSEDACRRRLYRIRRSPKSEQKLDEALLLEQAWFTGRAANTQMKKLAPIPKGATDASKLAPWKGRKTKGNAYRNTKTGYRPDIDLNVRSGWEANVCRIMRSYDIPFEFEPVVFSFPIKRGNKSYCPDFYLPSTDEWIEVKGYFDSNSMIKMRRFKKYFPEEWAKLTMIISKSSKASREFCSQHGVPNVLYYQDLDKIYRGRVNNWEGK